MIIDMFHVAVLFKTAEKVGFLGGQFLEWGWGSGDGVGGVGWGGVGATVWVVWGGVVVGVTVRSVVG